MSVMISEAARLPMEFNVAISRKAKRQSTSQ